MRSSFRFWLGFIIISVLFLGVWFFYWETRNGHLGALSSASRLLPLSEEMQGDVRTVVELAEALMTSEKKEQVYLLLFQNNMELRAGGGFIGSFGILKIRDGKILEFSTHDTGNFDGRIPDTTPAPYPLPETLRVKSLKMRDSNLSPDWRTNALLAEDFYRQGRGEEQFDGVIGITTNVLSSFLTVTGPVEVPGYPGTYDAENGVIDLEYQVEKGFDEQGIERGERKSVMNLLGNIILARVKELSLGEQMKLAQVLLDDLHKKDIQIYFKDERLQDIVRKAGWSGEVDAQWRDDYLMLVDANMGAFKTDYRIKRRISYTLDMRFPEPQAIVRVTYEHTGKMRDYMTKDYQSFSKIYAPEGSWLDRVEGHAEKLIVFGDELGKKFFGTLIHVPLGTTKTVTWTYKIPKERVADLYDLKIEKQAGVNDLPVKVTIIRPDGSEEIREVVLNRPFVWSETEQ